MRFVPAGRSRSIGPGRAPSWAAQAGRRPRTACIPATGRLLGLWGEPGFAHMAVMERASARMRRAQLRCRREPLPLGRPVASAGDPAGARRPRPRRARARRPRRLARLARSRPVGTAPSARRCRPARGAPAGYAFLPAEGESLHQIPVGPVHAGIIEPGHFRFTANGETVVRLEERLGYVHKGIEALMAGASIERAAVLAGRVSGDSTVAYALAFARAVEAALGVEVPPRAVWLRALAGRARAARQSLRRHRRRLQRRRVRHDARAVRPAARAGAARGGRLLRPPADDGPGDPRGRAVATCRRRRRARCARWSRDVRRQFPELVELYDNTASLQDRTVGTGILSRGARASSSPPAATSGAPRGAASTRDARRAIAPYDQLQFEVPVLEDGRRECARLDPHPRGRAEPGADRADPATRFRPADFGAGLRRADAPARAKASPSSRAFAATSWPGSGSDADGKVERCHLRDPSWFQWPLLEAAIEGNIVADFPLCNKSFNCSYSGHDL